jgi:nucleoid-associated protein YgaU
MSIISFLKNVGADIFRGGDRSDDIREMLEKSLGDRIKHLGVTEDDGAVTLTGAADSQATKEKAALLAGNVKGIEKVDHDGLTFPVMVEYAPPPVPVQYYTIVKGDSLSKIAKHFYGNAMKYPALFEANKEVIKNPDLIYPGQVIRVPDLAD